MDKEQMTILFVQPGKRPVEKTIPHTLQDLQAQVGGTIEIVYPWPDRRVGLVCNDEGKLEGLPLNRAIPEIEDAIAGDFFLCMRPGRHASGAASFTVLPAAPVHGHSPAHSA